MARVDLKRRAEIGEAKRARTRAAILQAASACYATPMGAPVTVETVTQAAGLAKGTFYTHFQDLAALEAELGATLIAELDEGLQPARLAADHPLTRTATAVTVMLRNLAAAPSRARLAARAVVTMPEVGQAVQVRLRQDLADAQAADLLAFKSVDLAAGVVLALCERAAREIAAGRIGASAVQDIVRAVLRALGCTPDEAALRADEAAHHADLFANGRPRIAARVP